MANRDAPDVSLAKALALTQSLYVGCEHLSLTHAVQIAAAPAAAGRSQRSAGINDQAQRGAIEWTRLLEDKTVADLYRGVCHSESK